jgi:hypothetical protein
MKVLAVSRHKEVAFADRPKIIELLFGQIGPIVFLEDRTFVAKTAAEIIFYLFQLSKKLLRKISFNERTK